MPGERAHILLADDDEDLREVAGMLFATRGLDLTAVASGEEALATLAATAYDVVVLDENMAPGRGIDVVAARRAEGDATPMVLWTGAHRSLDAAERERLAVVVVTKSGVHELLRVVLELVADR